MSLRGAGGAPVVSRGREAVVKGFVLAAGACGGVVCAGTLLATRSCDASRLSCSGIWEATVHLTHRSLTGQNDVAAKCDYTHKYVFAAKE